jgi:hypothetical protein
MMSLSGEVSSTVLDDANDYHSVVNTTFFYDGIYGAPTVFVCDFIS